MRNKFSESSSSSSGGIGVVGLLGIAFVVLKLIGYIDWSWWWVTAPFWAGFAFALVIAVLALIWMGIVVLAAAYRSYKINRKFQR